MKTIFVLIVLNLHICKEVMQNLKKEQNKPAPIDIVAHRSFNGGPRILITGTNCRFIKNFFICSKPKPALKFEAYKFLKDDFVVGFLMWFIASLIACFWLLLLHNAYYI
jgi:hypothetical protein